MASSGIEYPKELDEYYHKLKMKKLHRYLSIVIKSKPVEDSDQAKGKKKKTLEYYELEEMPLKNGDDDEDTDGTFQILLDLLSDKKCRYVLFCWSSKNQANALREDIYFIQYIPEESPVKEKMLYTASAETLKTHFEGTTVIQLNDINDCKQEFLLSKRK